MIGVHMSCGRLEGWKGGEGGLPGNDPVCNLGLVDDDHVVILS